MHHQRRVIERLGTGVPGFDQLIGGGIPRGFFVAVVGEPGVGKTVFSIHFIAEGIRVGDKNIYVTTEESRDSLIKQSSMFGFDFERAINDRKLVIIDALMGHRDDPWSLHELDVDELINKIIEAKRYLGYGRARLVIDSMSAFWLDKPAMARKYSYNIKRVLYRWDFTALLTSQYAVTTSLGFGFGIEHVADGVIRFRKSIVKGRMHRYVIVEKMRQTEHSLTMHEIEIVNGKGMRVVGSTEYRKEDFSLPQHVTARMIVSELKKLIETPDNPI
ncbi:MAG: KaiC domain-containing protein [Hyperthermus sp.]|nr:MAG: KaiC domain-containing protein [Hyperthermus sp.]